MYGSVSMFLSGDSSDLDVCVWNTSKHQDPVKNIRFRGDIKYYFFLLLGNHETVI